MPAPIGWKSSENCCTVKINCFRVYFKLTVYYVYFAGDKGGDLADDLIRCGLLNTVVKYK